MDRFLDRLRREIEEATRGLGTADWERAPEGRWNSAQILEHLGRSYGSTAKMMESNLVAGSPQVRPAKFRELLGRIFVVQLGFFPSGAKSPAHVEPKGDPGPVALERAFSNLRRMEEAIAESEQRWGSHVPIATHIILGPMKASQWRKFHYLHGHHHLKQVRERAGGTV